MELEKRLIIAGLILIAIFWLTLVLDGHHDSSRRRSTYHQPKYSYTGIRYRY